MRLRSYREARGWSRCDLAGKASIAPRTLARIERGAQRPKPETLRALAAGLQVQLQDLAPGWERDEIERTVSGINHPGLGLKKLREDQKITLEQAANAAQVDPSTLWRFERGLHGDGKIAALAQVGGEEELMFRSTELAKLLGFPNVTELTDVCDEIALQINLEAERVKEI